MSQIETIMGSKAAMIVLALVAFLVAALLVLIIVRMLFGGRLRMPGGRARQARLGIVDAFDLDRQRQLIIVRRDNTEHLIMIGGPNDILIESEIVRVEARDFRDGRREKDAGIGMPGGDGRIPAPPAVERGETRLPDLPPPPRPVDEPMLPMPLPVAPPAPPVGSPVTFEKAAAAVPNPEATSPRRTRQRPGRTHAAACPDVSASATPGRYPRRNVGRHRRSAFPTACPARRSNRSSPRPRRPSRAARRPWHRPPPRPPRSGASLPETASAASPGAPAPANDAAARGRAGASAGTRRERGRGRGRAGAGRCGSIAEAAAGPGVSQTRAAAAGGVDRRARVARGRDGQAAARTRTGLGVNPEPSQGPPWTQARDHFG